MLLVGGTLRCMLVAVIITASSGLCCCWRSASAVAASAAITPPASARTCGGECSGRSAPDLPAPAPGHDGCECPEMMALAPAVEWLPASPLDSYLDALAAVPVLLLEVLELRPGIIADRTPPPLTALQTLALHCRFLN
jgi:hypothetical protein